MKTGVYPCYENQFQIDAAETGGEANMVPIADMETFSVSFDNGVEEWTPFDTQGWARCLMTAKRLTISVNGKRNVGKITNINKPVACSQTNQFNKAISPLPLKIAVWVKEERKTKKVDAWP